MRKASALVPLVMDVPIVTPFATRITRAPRVQTEVVAGSQATVARPAGKGPWPTFIFLTGAHPLRRVEPVVERLTLGLARAGYLTVTPDLPGLGEGQMTKDTLAAAAAVTQEVSERPDVNRGRVGLVGASAGASLALLVASRPDLGARISVVIAVAPFADVKRLLYLATTGSYDDRSAPSEPALLLRQAVARSFVATLEPGEERDRLLAAIPLDEESDIDFPTRLSSLCVDTDSARAVLDCLLNTDPARFEAAYLRLSPSVQHALDELSPLQYASLVRAPVEIVVPPSDPYFPIGEANALADALPRARLTSSGTLDHTRPALSTGGARDLFSFLSFVVRGLSEAL